MPHLSNWRGIRTCPPLWVENDPRGAAELLGINPNTLRGRMGKLGIAYKRNKRQS
ncbi:MAG: hypothetical protein HYV06_08710 [Deltaproteobacteria bacterium]|nr:hypothetical protein [Deltaproteobacteria bacterium]